MIGFKKKSQDLNVSIQNSSRNLQDLEYQCLKLALFEKFRWVNEGHRKCAASCPFKCLTLFGLFLWPLKKKVFSC